MIIITTLTFRFLLSLCYWCESHYSELLWLLVSQICIFYMTVIVFCNIYLASHFSQTHACSFIVLFRIKNKLFASSSSCDQLSLLWSISLAKDIFLWFLWLLRQQDGIFSHQRTFSWHSCRIWVLSGFLCRSCHQNLRADAAKLLYAVLERADLMVIHHLRLY